MFLLWVSVCRTLNLLLTCCAAGESIPIRLFLAGYEMTPTMRDINKKFSVRYYLNLVLIDEEERRYFKQQVHTLHKASCWLGSLSVILLLTPQEFYSVLGYSDCWIFVSLSLLIQLYVSMCIWHISRADLNASKFQSPCCWKQKNTLHINFMSQVHLRGNEKTNSCTLSNIENTFNWEVL